LPIFTIGRGLTTIEVKRSRSALGEVGLMRNSLTPARMASVICERPAGLVSMMVGRFGRGNRPGERTMRRTSMPFRIGISQSSSMMSGSRVRIASSAARPSPASITDLAPRFISIMRVTLRI